MVLYDTMVTGYSEVLVISTSWLAIWRIWFENYHRGGRTKIICFASQHQKYYTEVASMCSVCKVPSFELNFHFADMVVLRRAAYSRILLITELVCTACNASQLRNKCYAQMSQCAETGTRSLKLGSSDGALYPAHNDRLRDNISDVVVMS